MSFDSSIIAHFGGDTTDLKASTEEASIMMKGFSTAASRSINEIGQGFVGAVVFMEAVKGIKEISSAAMDAAEQERATSQITGKAISDQGQAWLSLKDGIGDAKSGVLGFVTSAVSMLPEIGEGLGDIINTMRGISPEAQTQYDSMANTATTTLATIKAAHDKFLADLPTAYQATNDKIRAIDLQLADDEMTIQEKLDDNLQRQLQIKTQMAATNPSSLAYEKETLQLKQDQLAAENLQAQLNKQQSEEDQKVSEMALEMDKQTVAQNQQAFKVRSDTMTIEEQIVDLADQQDEYNGLALQDGLSEKQIAVYQQAQAQAALDMANKMAEVRKSTALSEADQLAIFIKETPALQNLNTLSNDGLLLLQQQSQEKQTQYQIDQLVALGVDNLNTQQKALLATLVQQSSERTKHIALIQQAVAAENQLQASEQAVLQTENEIDDAKQQQVDGAKGGSGGIPGYNTIITGSGVGGVNTQYQDQQSMANAKANLEAEQKAIESRINGYENSDDPQEESLVAGLQAQLNALHQQEIDITPANLNGTPPQPYAAPSSNTLQLQQNQLLQSIHDAIVPAFKNN